MEDPQGIGDNQASAPTIGAVFYEVEPRKIMATKGCVGLTSFMILLSVVFCLARGKYDYTFYLMAINVLISAIIILFTCFWYKSGDLDPSKWWFLIVVSAVIIFQCITTDIYVFQHENPNAPGTLAPPTTKPGFQTLLPRTTIKALLGQAAGEAD
ncbi:uncharacterized protein LOC117303634 [Asterias rubens]|uniref:uncharacterized protein LOC117303634 n=1 Tax=Asterias rubens TaxID=7604 RepID=UPI001455D638|nr:uncharacterized protein LOC117303634 [Asterias rubens]